MLRSAHFCCQWARSLSSPRFRVWWLFCSYKPFEVHFVHNQDRCSIYNQLLEPALSLRILMIYGTPGSPNISTMSYFEKIYMNMLFHTVRGLQFVLVTCVLWWERESLLLPKGSFKWTRLFLDVALLAGLATYGATNTAACVHQPFSIAMYSIHSTYYLGVSLYSCAHGPRVHPIPPQYYAAASTENLIVSLRVFRLYSLPESEYRCQEIQ